MIMLSIHTVQDSSNLIGLSVRAQHKGYMEEASPMTGMVGETRMRPPLYIL